MREWLRILFQREGFDVVIAADGLAAREIVARDYFDVVLTDIRMPRLDGVQLLRAVRELAPDVVVLMMTAHWREDSDEWKHAQELGAEALFEKPFRTQPRGPAGAAAAGSAGCGTERRAAQHDGRPGLCRHHRPEHGDGRRLPAGRDLCRTNSTILITGGRAREGAGGAGDPPAVASPGSPVRGRQLRRHAGPCSSPLFGRPRRLHRRRHAQEGAGRGRRGARSFSTRLARCRPPCRSSCCGCSRNVASAGRRHRGGGRQHPRHRRDQQGPAADGGRGPVREDLFYRLNVIPIRLPALRERPGDIDLIARHFLERLTREMGKSLDGFSPEALAAMETYQWPGNVRELENVIERAVALEPGWRVELETLSEVRAGRPMTPRAPPPVRPSRRGRSARRRLQSRAPPPGNQRQTSTAHSSRPGACRPTRPSCSASASGSSATWRRNTDCARPTAADRRRDVGPPIRDPDNEWHRAPD